MPNFRAKRRAPLPSSRTKISKSTVVSRPKIQPKMSRRRTIDSRTGSSNRSTVKKNKRFLLLLLLGVISVVIVSFLILKTVLISDWDGHHRYNLIFRDGADTFTLLSVGGDQREVVWQTIPSQIEGEKLPVMEENDSHKLEKLVLAYHYGIFANQIFEREHLTSLSNRSDILRFLVGEFVTLSLDYPISLRDRWNLWWYVFSLRPGQTFVEPLTLESGLPREQVRDQLSRYLLDIAIKQQGTSVAVINTTNISGLAGRMSESLATIGYSVVRVDSATESQVTSQVLSLSSEPPDPYELQQLLVFIPQESHETRPEAQLFQQYRSDLLIFLGEDLRFAFEAYLLEKLD